MWWATLAAALVTGTGCTEKGTSARFRENAERQNKTYPIRLNETVTIDSTRYDEKNNTVSYYYTVTGVLDDPEYMNSHYAAFRQALKDAVDNSVEMEEYRKAECSIKYIYISKKSQSRLAEFSF